MSRLSRTLPLALTLSLGLSVIGCVTPPITSHHSTVKTSTARLGSATLILTPEVVDTLKAQAVVEGPSKVEDIVRIDVFPLVETSAGVYQALLPDGGTTAVGDENALKVSQSKPDLNFERPIELTGLAAHTKYRILGRAYDKSDKLISSDEVSFVDIVMQNDDAPTVGTLPIKLPDVHFAARTTISFNDYVDQDPDGNFETAEISVIEIANGTETPLPNSAMTRTRNALPLTLKLDNLRPQTAYRLNITLRDADNRVVKMTSARVYVSNDDEPATQTVSLTAMRVVETLVPPETSGYLNGPVNTARFNQPSFMASDGEDRIFVADSGNHVIRMISRQGDEWTVSTIAGPQPTDGSTNNQTGFVDGIGASARFYFPRGLTRDAAGNLYVADMNNSAIRMISQVGDTWQVTTIAGSPPSNGVVTGNTNGPGPDARFNLPVIVVSSSTGELYVNESLNKTIRKIHKVDGEWHVSYFSGGVAGGHSDGQPEDANFFAGINLAVDPQGYLYVGDASTMRLVTPEGVVSTIAGTFNLEGLEDGIGAEARMNRPFSGAFDSAGNLYMVGTSNSAIRRLAKVNGQWELKTVAGAYPVADNSQTTDGIGKSARFKGAAGITSTPSGILYVTEMNSNAIRVAR